MTDWIDAEDRLPEREGPYIVAVIGEHKWYSTAGIYYENGQVFQVNGEYPQVTHWMEFPEPPGIVASLANPSLALTFDATQNCGIMSESVQKRIDDFVKILDWAIQNEDRGSRMMPVKQCGWCGAVSEFAGDFCSLKCLCKHLGVKIKKSR